MVNSLTREASVRFGPLLLETLLKHYFDRLLKDKIDSTSQGRVLTQLRKDELLYDEAFIIVKVRVNCYARLRLMVHICTFNRT